MGFLSPFLRIALVWLTAVTVLLAGSPIVVCHCPNGRHKLFCLRPAAPSDCCSVSAAKPTPKKKSCCHAHRQTDGAPSECGGRMEQPRCNKELASPLLPAAMESSSAASSIVLPTCFVPLLSLDTEPKLPDFAAATLSDPKHSQPPPFDRIITLRHLVI